ncbi:MAG TPA: DUF4349 domain-containing protein [Solirubrobacteraceae bacterium]
MSPRDRRAARRAARPSDAQTRELDALDAALARGNAALARGEAPQAGADAELARLVLAVREDHPPLRPAFADELGIRVAAGFPRRSGRRAPDASGLSGRAGHGGRLARGRTTSGPGQGWGARRQWLVGLGAAASLAVGVVVVAGVPSSAPSSGSSGHARSSPPAVGSAANTPSGALSSSPGGPAASPEAPAGGPASASSSTGQVTAPATAQSIAPPLAPAPTGAAAARAVESDASLSLLAPRGQVQHVADETIAATDRLGGVVESSHVSVDDAGGSQATLALEVPSSALDRTLAAISSLAHVSSRSQDTQDITDPTGAARQRLAESRDERVALLRQLGRATTPNQVAAIHGQLGLVDGRIAKDQASLKALVGRAQSASVNVTIAETARPGTGGSGQAGSSWRPGRAVDDALGVLEACFAVLVVALAGLVPIAGVAGFGWWAARLVRRRRRQGALANAA